MNKKKFHDFDESDEWLERLLDEYVHNRLPEVPIEEEEEIPSAEFCRKMEKLINNPHKWKKYMYAERRRIRRLETIRATAFATIAIAFLILTVRQFEPIRTSAFIPTFVLERVDWLDSAGILNPNLVVDSLENDEVELPRFVVGYIPSDFVHDSTSDRAEKYVESYVSQSREALFDIAIMMFGDERDVYFDEGYVVEQIVIGDKDVTKMTGYDACIYLWKEGDYLLKLRSYQTDEREMEQVIKTVSLLKAK